MSIDVATRRSARVTFVCNICGSDDIRVDAWGSWNADAQQWEVAETFTNALCNRCGGECSAFEKVIR